MGQISLPRLEKINTVMSWESNLLFNNERWAGAKLLIFYRLLTNYTLKKKHYKFKYDWNKYLIINYNTKIKLKRKRRNKFRYKFRYNLKLKIINNYIYQYNNKYISLIFYTTMASKHKMASYFLD